jgi:hypothetical protein
MRGRETIPTRASRRPPEAFSRLNPTTARNFFSRSLFFSVMSFDIAINYINFRVFALANHLGAREEIGVGANFT